MVKLSLIKRRFVTSFLCLLLAAGGMGLDDKDFNFGIASASAKVTNQMKGKSNKTSKAKQSKLSTFAKPDFAYPKSVEADAEKQYRAALASHNGLLALQAAIQLNVAQTLVSTENYPASLARYDEIAGKFPSPWSDMALLLKARLYRDIYYSQPYIFNNRKLPSSPRPENVMEWSTQMLADVVRENITTVMANDNRLASMPLKDIAGLLTDIGDAEKKEFTVFDFCTLQSEELLQTFSQMEDYEILPLSVVDRLPDTTLPTTSNITPQECIERAISICEAENNTAKLAFWYNNKFDYLRGKERTAFLEKCIDRFTDTPYCAIFFVNYCRTLPSDNDGRRNKLRLLDDYSDRYPDAENIALVKNMQLELKQKEVNVTFPSQVLPHKENKVTVKGQNLYDYNLLVVALKNKGTEANYKYSDLLQGKIEKIIPVLIPASVPDVFNDTIALPPLKPGLYSIVPSTSSSFSGLLEKDPRSYLSTMNVSELSVIQISESSKENMLFVVNGSDQQPIEGAQVNIYKSVRGQKIKQKTAVSDAEGKVKYPSDCSCYKVEYNGSTLSGYLNRMNPRTTSSEKVLKSNVLTDLAIYHPGDEVNFSAIVYSKQERNLMEEPEKEISVILRDANWMNVDTVSIITDKFGRANGKFTIPKDRLVGDWGLIVKDKDKHIGSSSFIVAEYKAPTFLTELEAVHEQDDAEAGRILNFKGKAVTYSGMPVAGCRVEYIVSYQPGWWRSDAGYAKFGGETITNADGSFEIILDTAGLKGTPYARGVFLITGSVTNNAGQTVELSPLRFSLGNDYGLFASIPELIKVTDKEDSSDDTYKVNVYDFARVPVQKTVYYRILSDDKIVDKGSFVSPAFKPSLSSLPSGKYVFEFSLTDNFEDSATGAGMEKKTVILWRESDRKPPVSTALWCPETKFTFSNSDNKVAVKVGSSLTPGYILAIISNSGNYVKYQWLKVNDGIVEFNVDLTDREERYYVDFVAESDLESSVKRVIIIPQTQLDKLTIKSVSFRDKVSPGGIEKWKFSFSMDGVPMSDIPAFAVMTDKALNSIVPFGWAFDPYSTLSWNTPVSINTRYYGFETNYYSAYIKYFPLFNTGLTPNFNTYGYSLFSRGMNFIHIRGVKNEAKFRSVKQMAGGADFVSEEGEDSAVLYEAPVMAMATSAVADVNAELMTESEGAATDGGSEVNDTSGQLREIGNPIAFFMPALVSDGAGDVEVSFTAPDFIGTWQFQIAGYTPELRGSTLTLDAVSAKTVMAQMNAPRFVRTGDEVSLSAMIYNNSEQKVDIEADIEIINALTGDVVYSSGSQIKDVEASGSAPVSISFKVPADVEALMMKVMARSGSHTDGEQTIVPVLPATSVVNESSTFYLGTGMESTQITLPEFKSDASVTLSYVGNPVWECLTALPALSVSESENIIDRTNVLFGISVSAGLLKKYPVLAEALREMSKPENSRDSLLISPLEKNMQLKNYLLQQTPWVNSAITETLRMQSLLEYEESSKAAEAIAQASSFLINRQNSDGGWGWCSDMKSSSYITRVVLSKLGSLNSLSYFPAELLPAIQKGFSYLDRYYVSEWEDSKRKSLSLNDMINYLYERNSFKNLKKTPSFVALENAVIEKVVNEWKKLGIYNKATAAILLMQKGKTQTASLILESLSQYASVTPEKGMWFDNLTSNYFDRGPLLTTARVLQAYSMAGKDAVAIDQLRQWLVLSKQTQDWNGGLEAAEVIASILESGSDWNVAATYPEIRLGDQKLEIPSTALLTGAFTMKLSPDVAAGKTLFISREGNVPAWGGVVARFVSPIKDTKAVSIPELKVTKALFVAAADSKGVSYEERPLSVGDKVNVTITITCDRDLDYVALQDNRAACLEPVDQTSGYTATDGVWYYQEVRNSVTNLFIPHLTKGTHVLSYECYVDRSGIYSLGIVSAQSQYAPLITASSAGKEIQVLKKE